MASLSKKLSENSSETLRAVVELLHDSPSWPDFEPVLKLLRTQTRFLQDIKFEVHRIESMVDGAQRPFTRDQNENGDPAQDGKEGKDDAGAGTLPTKQQLLDLDMSSNWVDPNQMLVDELEDEIRRWSLEGLGDILHMSFSPDKVVPRLRHYILSRKLDKVRDQINALPSAKDIQAVMNTVINSLERYNKDLSTKLQNETDKLLSEMQSLQLPLVDRLDRLSESVIHCCDDSRHSFEAISVALTNLNDKMTQSNDALTQLIISSTKTLNSGIASILTKIEDCCVKQEISGTVIPTLNTVTEDTSDILRIVKSGGSPVTLSSNGAILAAIKSVQSELAEIRRLL